MADLEKVIKGLETCIPMKYETNEEKECRHEQCPYGRENYKPMNGCFWDLMADALALLKEQQPRVLSKEELYALPDETDVWCEQRDSKRMFAMTTFEEEYFKLQPTFTTGLGLNDIRIWTARPTDEQRKAVPCETH